MAFISTVSKVIIGAMLVVSTANTNVMAATKVVASPKVSLVAGIDYVLIEQPGVYQAQPGKVELVEAFSYACPHCAHFEPAMTRFKNGLPQDVVTRYVPAAMRDDWVPFARAYETARILGVDQRSHAAMFRALHDNMTLPLDYIQPSELAKFYTQYGIASDVFIATYNSAAVDAAIAKDDAFLRRAKVPGTPSLIVNGKYLVLGRDIPTQFRNAALLIRQERAALPR